ncbi:hypothetical protein HPB48_002051 [Haemaphysalis longicornis]|uniref:Uncharacterized protein n=1 Tax=Haemaphysalis longicornis TaxID=44386 RepID=A0A9J6FIA6_HAELO|nr:hypothetical protein HPB48_002051 [Haemaphysalis longicornis]
MPETNLSLQMAKDKGYSRIQMTWSDPDIAPLLAAVALTSESPTELHVRCINDFSEGSVCALLENLAKNTKVEVLIIEVAQHRRQAVNVLCTTLALNQGIRRLRVTTAPREASDCGCFSLVAKALIFNHTVAEVTMESETTCLRSVKTIAYLLSRNTSITKLAVNCNNWITVKRFAILSRAVNKNKSILEFSLPKGIEANCVSHRILRALRRNISLHNLAITFVTRERLDRRAAQAVEELCTSASFVTEVMNAKGQGAKEARCTTLSTYRYIQSNYFRLTGVVCGTVVCYPSASTQLDDLNYDCWCNIVKHLKLSDVVQTQP